MTLASLFGIVVALIWAAQPVISKFGYQASMTALDLTFLRYLVSGLLVLPFTLRAGLGSAFGLGWRRAAALMLLAGPVYSLVLIGGLAWAPASHGALIYPAFTPVFSAIFAKLILDRSERLSPIGLALIVVGVLTIGAPDFRGGLGLASGTWRGDLFFVCAACMWALYIVLMRKWKADPYVAMRLVQTGAIAYVPAYLFFKGTSIFHFDPRQIALQALFLGVVVSIVAVTLFNLVVRQLGARASLFTALVPLFGVALSAYLLREPVTLPLVAGTSAIMVGLALSMKQKTARGKETQPSPSFAGSASK